MKPVDEALDRFLALVLWSVPVGLVAAGLVGRWMAGRALAPLVRLATATRGIHVTNLGQRLPVRGANDELDQVAHAFNDTLAQLDQAVGDMRQFSAALAHELRTPLAALRGETELALLSVRSPEESARALASQLEELDKLARLINELLTLARAEAGEIPFTLVDVDLSKLAASIVEQLEPVAQVRGIDLVSDAAAGVVVVGDSGWIERLLLNLLDNAIKFTDAGGRIVVRVWREREVACLDVSDTGKGIAPEALPHVFDRFYQADPSRSSGYEGAGLGLTLAKWIADRHGATLQVRSEPGRGTTFSLRMSIGRPVAHAVAAVPAGQDH
jgi:heavy metal sensor kinase